MHRATFGRAPESEIELRQPDQLGWLSRGNAISGIVGFVAGTTMVVTLLLVGADRAGTDPVPASTAIGATQYTVSVEASVPVLLGPTRELLIARSLARPVSFGAPPAGHLAEFAALQERLFADALALEATTVAEPTDERLALTNRSRAREIRFDSAFVITAQLQAFVEQQEWWATEL